MNVQTNVPQRHLQPEDIGVLKNVLPHKKVDFYVSGYNYDPESKSYAMEIVDYLKANNYNWAVDVVGQNIGTPPKEKIGKVEFYISDDSSVYFTIYPLK